MPTVILNKTVFEKLVGKKLPLEALKDRISMLGTDLDHIEGNEIRVEVFPNRPDMLSEQGFARAFASFIGTKPGLRKYTVKKSGMTVTVDKNVTMRPYTACAIVKNLALTDEHIRELMQIQEKLATTHGRNRKRSAYGIYPLDSITFPLRYTAKDPKKVTFRPLGFDRAVTASDIMEHHPKGQQYRHITKGWKLYPFFIDANDRVMSMLPFTNSHDTGKVDTRTRDVFIECSGTDLENVRIALNIITTALADMGGDVHSVDVKYHDDAITTPDLSPRTITLDKDYANRLLGLNLTDHQITIALERMGYTYSNGKALVPAYRADILHQIDLVEDIAIAHGYENFAEDIPNVSTIAKESPRAILHRKLADILTGLGLLEIHTYHLSNNTIQNERMNAKRKLITLQSSVSEDYTCLRAWILPHLVETLSHNKHHEYPQNLYTIGTVFSHGSTETGIAEEDHLGIALCHDRADYTHIRQTVEYLLLRTGHTATFTPVKDPSYIPGRAAHIIVNNTVVGTIGELHPQVLENFKLELPAAAAELSLALFLQK